MDYKKYRWFFTKSGKLVYGGKSAEQNDEVVTRLIKSGEKRIVMHTKIPGSPFAIIDSPIEKVNESDLEECAVWCACFSRAWRNGLRKTFVDVFTSENISKKKGMKSGTFGVSITRGRKIVELKLVLLKQDGILRAVPLKTSGKKEGICIIPGKIDKDKFAGEISLKLKASKEEVLNALPSGGFKTC